MKYWMRFLLAPALAAVLFCTACGRTEASDMSLVKLEGGVSVADDSGDPVSPREGLRLYSGYGVATEPISYAWIDLDSVKLTKMDESSEIEIQRSGKHLEIRVNAGGLFFHVTEPLAEDETMTIRTSTMTVGIRGTCGWVRVDSPEQMAVYLLEGTVACAVTDPDTGEEETGTVSGGETALLVRYPQGLEGDQ